ncbi:Signal recognition particle receptor subunit beta [Diplonema papillatum]|nr:Signal recognition particle receptor subunit beta [Diplonema papillatum]
MDVDAIQRRILALETEYVVAIVIGIVTLLVIILARGFSGSRKKDTLLMIGLPTTGSTALYYKCFFDEEVETHTSMQENVTIASIGSKRVERKVVDYPGHHRLRPGLSQYLYDAFAIVLVIDSVNWEQHLSANAELIYTILTDPKIVLTKPQPKLAIACTKRDIDHSYKSNSIKKQLEQEIEKLRKTKTNVISQLGKDGSDAELRLGVSNQPFSFTAHSTLDTTFLDVSAVDAPEAFFREGTKPLKAWIDTIL